MAFSRMCLLEVFQVTFKDVDYNTDHPDKGQVRILEAYYIVKVSWGFLLFPSLAQMFILLYVKSKENRVKLSIS